MRGFPSYTALLIAAALLVQGGCADLLTGPAPPNFSTIERIFAPGDTGTLALQTGWILRVDATGAPEPYQVTFRDSPRQDFPGGYSGGVVELIYAAASGRVVAEPPSVEMRFELSRELTPEFVPRSASFMYAGSPGRAFVFGFLSNTCSITRGPAGPRVRLVAAFQVGPWAAKNGAATSFGTAGHLAVAPYLFRKDYIPACTTDD